MAPPIEHKHVLIVDDESSSRRLVERVVRGGIPGVRVSCTVDGAQALAVLDREAVDLLITDLSMPVLDGLGLLLEIARRRLLVPVLVMSARGLEAEARALAGGAIEYFPKPILVAPLLECVKHLLAAQVLASHLEVVSLAGLVRIVGMDRKTCALRVTAQGRQGVLTFVDGELVDARQDTLRGLAAALAILALKDPAVTLDLNVRSRTRTIDVHLPEVLRQAHLAATATRSLAPKALDRTTTQLEQPPDFRGTSLPKLEHAERPGATARARPGPIVPAPGLASTFRRPDIRPPAVSPPPAIPPPPATSPPPAISPQPVIPPRPVLSPPPPTLPLRSPPLASRTVTPPPVPAPPRVTAPPRAPVLASPPPRPESVGTVLKRGGANHASRAASGPTSPSALAAPKSPEASLRGPDPTPARAPNPVVSQQVAPEAIVASTLESRPVDDVGPSVGVAASAELVLDLPRELSEPTSLTIPEAAVADPAGPGAIAAPVLPEATTEISTHELTDPDNRAPSGLADLPAVEPSAPMDGAPHEPLRASADAQTGESRDPAYADTSATRQPTPEAFGAAPNPTEVLPTEVPPTEPTPTEPAATEAPATEAPATEAPATEAPATEVRATEAPATEAPATGVRATEAPATEAPATEVRATEVRATGVPAAVVAANVDGIESTDYFELMDRAHDLMRVAEFEVAELLLQRALQVRPGDRVVQQNLRILAKRRRPSQAVNP